MTLLFSFPCLAEYGDEFDYLFIQFYNNYCHPGDQYFLPVMDTWLKWARSIPNGPLIVLGLPAGPEAAGKPHYYFPPDKLAAVYKVLLTDHFTVVGLVTWSLNGSEAGARSPPASLTFMAR